MLRLDRLVGVLRAQRGQSMTEYAILLVWICLLVFAAITSIGHNLAHLFNSTASRV